MANIAGRTSLLLLVVLALVAVVAAGGNSQCAKSFEVKGRKFKLQNRPLSPGEGVVCPEGNPSSTVTFCNVGSKVKIFGNFAAADLGVCDPSVNPYTLPAGALVPYEQYDDIVVLRPEGRVPSAFRVMVLGGKNIALGLSGQRYGVSTFVDAGPANC